ncbi:MAG: bacterioferritin-associated ferredoxin [Sulfuricella sp.]|nr:bacterioferritin-associated ferredoxin [Sulfuricella sp.]
MYVCLCQGVTDGQIREAASAGACSMRDLCANLGVASQCGKCAKCAHKILQESLAGCANSGRAELAAAL